MLWCHAFLKLWRVVLALLPNALTSFTFLQSLDGMESSSESSAIEEAHGDEQGSLSSSARKLFALWERKRSVVIKRWGFFFLLLYVPSPSLHFLF